MSRSPANLTDFDCPAKETLVEYSLGTLSRRFMECVADHLDYCESCLDLLQSLDDRTDDLVLQLRQQGFDVAKTEYVEGGLVDQLPSYVTTPTVMQGSTETILLDQPRGQIGPYQILEKIGEGGMGKVYRARHVHLDRVVALKVLSPQRLSEPEAVARFNREMKAVGQVNHPNIVLGFDAGVAGVPYLAMELIEGTDLGALVKKRGRLPIAEACECIRQAALGLQHAHERGLVHRDLKPSNLMLTPQGVVKILDLGLARVVPELPEPSRPATKDQSGTRDDTFMGTPGYVAPEQIRGAHAVDIRADLYGLGCTLFYLLVGFSPAGRATSNDTQPVAGLSTLPPDVRSIRPEVPRRLVSLIAQLLASDPEHRPGSPADLAALLLPFVTGANPVALLGLDTPAVQGHKAPAEQTGPRGQGASAWLIAIPTFFLVLAGMLVVFWWRDQAQQSPTPGPDSPLIHSLVVEQFRHQQEALNRLGAVGDIALPPPLHTDSFRVRAQLNAPGYCYVLAFGPETNGVLCVPGDVEDAPRRTRAVRYPAEGNAQLSRPGLYAIALLASRSQLPDFAARPDRLPGFRGEPQQQEGVWQFDGKKITMLRGGAVDFTQTRIPVPIRDLCNALSGEPACEVRILAFTVR